MRQISSPEVLRAKLLAGAEGTDDPDGCWLWTRNKLRGYGLMYNGQGNARVHRVSYEVFREPIPAGMEIDHLCHTDDAWCAGGNSCLHRSCINPQHMEVVTSVENARRRGNTRRGMCGKGLHEWIPENIKYKTNGERQCYPCWQSAFAKWKQRQRDAG